MDQFKSIVYDKESFGGQCLGDILGEIKFFSLEKTVTEVCEKYGTNYKFLGAKIINAFK